MTKNLCNLLLKICAICVLSFQPLTSTKDYVRNYKPFFAKRTQIPKSQVNVNNVLSKEYEKWTLGGVGKTNPKRTQTNPNEPKQSQLKPIKANKMPKRTQNKPKRTQNKPNLASTQRGSIAVQCRISALDFPTSVNKRDEKTIIRNIVLPVGNDKKIDY